MMYLSDTNGKERVWHIGEARPGLLNDICEEVQADGDELEYIENNFSNIPYRKGVSVLNWKGDIAQFIYDHIRADK